MTRGTVLSYDLERGSGYIEPDDDEHERIPFDDKSLDGFAKGTGPSAGDRVSFQVEGGMAGIWAIHVRLVDAG